MERPGISDVLGVMLTALSWIGVGFLLLAIVWLLIKGDGWLYLN